MISFGRAHRLTLLVANLLLALYLLLALDKVQLPSRSLLALWNIAHTPLFIMLTLAFDQVLVRHHPRPTRIWLARLCPPLILFALGTEWLQSLTDRQPSLTDALMNLYGVALGTLWLYARRYAATKRRPWLRALTLASFLLLFVTPLRLSLADAHRTKAFPVLSDFEHWSDPLDWSAGKRSNAIARDGNFSLEVNLPAKPYAGATLRHFSPHWQPYSTLHLSVFNPAGHTLQLSLRVHDWQHFRSNEAYNDRFNLNFEAKPGWTDLAVPLEKIAAAAHGREIQLNEIQALRVFYQGTPAEGTVFYLDGVRLE